MTQNTSVATDNSEWKPLLGFFGKGDELFVIYLKNFFFSCITLGIYHFWGIVNVRKYLWSKTYLWGEPLEYTGTGKELFISFLIVFPAFMIVMVALQMLLHAVPVVGAILMLAMLLLLTRFAVYRTFRYRLTRTKWRGIRGNLTGSAIDYAWKAALYDVLTVCSLGLLVPIALSKTTTLLMNNMYFGDRKFSFNGPAKPLFVPYIVYLAALALLIGCFIAFLVGIEEHAQAYSEDTVITTVMVLYLCILGMIYFGVAFLVAAIERWFYGHTTFGEIKLRSTLSGLDLFRLRLVNMLCLIITFGIAYAWIQMKEYGLRFGCTLYNGDLQLEQLLQDTQPAPARGEGLLEALEIDLAM